MKKIIIALVIALVVASSGWFVYQKYFNKTQHREVLSVVPEDAVYMLKTNNLTKAWNEVQKTNIWKHLIKTTGFEDFQTLTTTLNEVLLNNKASKYIFKNRPTLMSAHLISSSDYDFLYVVDLQGAKTIKQALGYLLKLDQTHQKIQLTYKGQKIYKLIDKKDSNSTVFITTLDNLLISSFNYGLVKKVIDEKDKTHWLDKPDFIKINDNLEGELVQFYFNFKQVPGFAQVYMNNGKQATESISKQLKLSGFDIAHDDERILMSGVTLTDSLPSYFNALLDVKPGKIKAYNIITQRTALYFSLGFKNFNLFYQSFLEQMSKKDKYTIRKQTRTLEKYLGINLQKDIYDWIGQEIALIKINTKSKQRTEDVLLLIQANDMSDAKAGMTNITEKIRKRSPVKFKKYTYKNLEINYLYQKGFFKALLGDLFKKIDKPYFSYIENYVVFSNSEQVLKDFIDDYIKGNTLSHDSDFMDFKDEWSAKANVNLYLYMPKFYKILEKNLDVETRKAIAEKKDFLLSMSRINLQLISKDDKFKTLAVIDHDEKALQKEQANDLATKIDKNVHNDYYADLQFKIAFPDSLQVSDGKYKQFFSDGKTLKIEGKVDAGLPTGIWRVYYPDGKLKSVVNYKDGNVDGEAFFYYDKSPETKMAETTFDDDLLNGVYTEYWQNGAIKAELNYEDGKLYGKAKYYYPNGKIKIEGKYKKGEKKGKWLFYDQKGNVIDKKRYSNFLGF